MWQFLSRGHGETEGFSNGSLAEFKGNPLQALAREICQNSLDAADGSGPVIVEFEARRMKIVDFPGMIGMRDVITACDQFWKGKSDLNTATFLKQAKECLQNPKGEFTALRISDYNTTGVRGAFSEDVITPWGGLVKGNAFSVKTDTSNAAGSYGIGKAAPFVSSYFQTVFYRTLDKEGVRASLGVARLMAHESIVSVPEGEDPIRRSVGYFGADDKGKPAKELKELEAWNHRDRCGTDLFIPGFTGSTYEDSWAKDILKEIVDNFLYSIFSGKLEVRIGQRILNKKSLKDMLDIVGSKDAKAFYEVLRQDNKQVVEIKQPFHNLGTLRLRLLYAPELNKKILVVRNSGMKIARISSLPRMISYTGFLELQGGGLNEFFRGMENPSHNAWEPRRHSDQKKAREYKEELEDWVIAKITEKLVELSGEESVINVGDCFNYTEGDAFKSEGRKTEKVTDAIREVKSDVYTPQLPSTGTLSIRDEGKRSHTRQTAGREDPNGESVGTRHRSGKTPGGEKKGRKVVEDPNGIDRVNIGEGGNPHEVKVSARIISTGSGVNKLLLVAEEHISLGRLEIVTRGENGRSMRLSVKEASGEGISVEQGHIVLREVEAHVKQTIEFKLAEKHNFAMGVKAYGN